MPRLVALARDGDVVATARLESWIRAARAGDTSALAVAADVVENGFAADESLIAAAERHAAEEGRDARTGFLRSVLSGTAQITPSWAAQALGMADGRTAVDAAGVLADYLDVDLTARVLVPEFEAPAPDPEDAFDAIAADSEVTIASGSTKKVCKEVNYYDYLGNFTVMGMEVCTTWKYDGVRYVASGSRTLAPYVSLIGTVHGWRWSGTNLYEHYYYNYKRKGTKSGYHTKTVGHFQRCVTQELVVPYCDQDEFPAIVIDGHYDGTFSHVTKP